MKTSPTIAAIYGFNRQTELKSPLFAGEVSAGFPSPADDYVDSRLDLNDFLVKHPAATFFVRVAGDSMIGAGIHHGDILVVDRSLEPVSGKVVIAVVNGELTVKRLQQENGLVRLVAENPDYPPIELTEETAGEIWGVVTSVIHSL
ncbi:LexA family protein [Desulfurivibrio sp. C05AmB]|uniref:LexA family protein n=1 Tax=Desulfurivibrio sp. C05AmB TaxID=3374371 RepID=UPI00376EA874